MSRATSKPRLASTLSVKAYRGDAKTLLAFNYPTRASATNLAGFTIEVEPPGVSPYYIYNKLQFAKPGDHAQVVTEPAYSSVNAPIHKFRWLHIPGAAHGVSPVFGNYVYRVTPRFFDAKHSMLPLDKSLTVECKIDVHPFSIKGLTLGFTRGYVQSQAYVDNFGLAGSWQPKGDDLVFDMDQVAGTNPKGASYTFEEEYAWSGFTARKTIYELLDEVISDKTLKVDVFAYDLSEPGVISRLLQLAKQGRVRVILDNADLHVSTDKKDSKEDMFEAAFNKVTKKEATIKRGKFGRYSHDKVMVVSDASGALKVLTGSTNFSVTGMYVNSNHVLVFSDRVVAAKYQEVFNAAWVGEVKKAKFLKSDLSSNVFSHISKVTPQSEFTFSPHDEPFATKILDGLAERINGEAKSKNGSVLFAVMALDASSSGSVVPALQALHNDESVFSYGITDSKDGTSLYSRRSKKGVLVTGKPGSTSLPAPFNQLKQIGLGHQIHHKFVVCGFNGPNPVVYCGSSNLALGGEENNGDNLIAIHDGDVATAFAIEALSLVDHFDFLNKAKTKDAAVKPKASKRQLAKNTGWFLGVTDKWVDAYYDKSDLHFVDRVLFGG